MSLQAIAGVAYDRHHPDTPTTTEQLRRAAAALTVTPVEQSASQSAAKQLNGALESLKRYIPTEFLALYLPFIAIAHDQKDRSSDWITLIYIGFLIATPFAVFLIFIAKEVEAGKERVWTALPLFEATLATVSFAIWGACVPSMFPGNQWWLSMLAMASAFVLPLIDTAFSKIKTV